MESTGKYWIPICNILELTCKIVLANWSSLKRYTPEDDTHLLLKACNRQYTVSQLKFISGSLVVTNQEMQRHFSLALLNPKPQYLKARISCVSKDTFSGHAVHLEELTAK